VRYYLSLTDYENKFSGAVQKPNVAESQNDLLFIAVTVFIVAGFP